MPAPFALPQGCRFHPRCVFAADACTEIDPPLRDLLQPGGPDHRAACIRAPVEELRRGMTAPLLEVEGLAKHYPMTRGLIVARTVGTVRAVDGLGFTLARGETLALVGESGCGKTPPPAWCCG